MSNYKNLLDEPADHAIGRSRGGLSTKVHQLVDGRGLPLVVLIGPGQGGDSPMLPALLEALAGRTGRAGATTHHPGRGARATRRTPRAATRALLRARGITAVIAEPADQTGHRKRRGSKGGRPPAFDPARYKDRNVVERSYQAIKQWRALATRYDKLAITYRAGAAHPRRRPMAQALGDTP